MTDKLLLTRAEIAAWLGISASQAKRLPLKPLPVVPEGQVVRHRTLIARDAVLRYLSAQDGPDAPPFPVRRRPRRRQ